VTVDQPSAFGDQLRRLRRQRGLSIRDLAKEVNYSKSLIGEWETGKKTPTADAVARLDSHLHGDGALTAAAADIVRSNGHTDRLAHVAAAPRTVDAAAVDALAGVLANMRRLEDTVGAGPLLTATAGPLRLVETLADEARGPIRPRVVDLAGQWSQFAGWLRAATGQPAKARDWYARTLEHATEVGNEDLIATSLSMRGNLAWMARQPGPVIGLSGAAAQHAASPGVRAMAQQQEARGHAVIGDADAVERLLDRAEADMAEAADRPDEEPAWIYFYSPGYLQMQRGLAYRLLGRHEAAVTALTDGLAATGETLQTSEFVAVYVLHLAEEHLALGNRDVAALLLEQVREVARSTGSERLAGQVAKLARQLDR
jgi:transcriptional regulator with XRE-family HTH domain